MQFGGRAVPDLNQGCVVVVENVRWIDLLISAPVAILHLNICGEVTPMSMSEEAVSQRILLDATEHDIWLMRNNSGAAMITVDQYGNELAQPRMVRFGLGNTSAQLNNRIKSSDYIGSTPILITQAMVGYMIGMFTAIEIKHSDWRGTTLNEYEAAQLEFHDTTKLNHGLAGFANSVEQFRQIVGIR